MTSLAFADRRWLDAAARQAAPFRGTTADNPTVGAIVVAPDGRLLGRAVTAPGGRPHAETQALDQAGPAARGATLYVTLEPCNHWGRTPPCVDTVLRAHVGRVVVGVPDPDPRTAGAGLERLSASGIEVTIADHGPSRRLHEGHFMRQSAGRPFVTAKLAVSADGMVGLPDQANFAITGEVARRWTHMQRALCDAVMVGWGTARIDDPQLTVRLPGLEDRRPLRVLVAGRRTQDARLTLLTSFSLEPIAIIATSEKKLPSRPGVEAIGVAGRRSWPDPVEGLRALAERGIQDVLIEGGPTLLESFLAAGLVDRFHLLRSEVVVGARGVPATAGGNIEARLGAAGLSLVDQRLLGADKLRTFEKVS